MRFKKLNMNKDIDKNIFLSYFFKKLDTPIDKEELLSMSSIYYNSNDKSLRSCTKRFTHQLAPYKNQKIDKETIEDTLKEALKDTLKIQEELVRCELTIGKETDYFYITVIGVDFFMIESDLRK